MSTVKFRHELSRTEYGPKGKRVTKENIINGDKGLSFRYLKKEDNDFYKIELKQDGDKYVGTEKNGDKSEPKPMSLSESDFKKLVSSNKYLNFLKEYLENNKSSSKSSKSKQSGGVKDQCGGSKLNSLEKDHDKKEPCGKSNMSSNMSGGEKKSSKKASKKKSKKSSKKKSKKMTGGAKKSSKKTSKKSSKKTSKKSSKKKSKKMSGGAKKSSKKSKKMPIDCEKSAKKGSKKSSKKY